MKKSRPVKKNKKKAAVKPTRRETGFQVRIRNAWQRKIERSLLKLEELVLTPALHGEVWKEKTGRYYVARLRAMLDVAPPNCGKLVSSFKQRIDKLPW